MGDTRREAIVIACSDLDLSARIASDWSEGGEFKSVESGD